MTLTPAARSPGVRDLPRSMLLIGLGVAAVLLLPLVADNYTLRLATTLLMYAVFAWSWNFIGGFVGYPSFGVSAFFGLGAYVGAVLLSRGYVPFWASPICGALAASVMAVLVGVVVLRLRGHYFAVASLALGEVFREIASSWTEVTGGGMGVTLPPMRPTLFSTPQLFLYAMLAVAVLSYLATVAVSRGRLGIAFRCIRQNEAAAQMIGIDTTRMKTIAFILSAVFTGAAGALYASWVSYIDPADVFSIVYSIQAPVMVLLGGVGTVFGPLLGAVVYMLFEEIVWRNLLQFHAGMLGVIIVLLVLYAPRGLLLLRPRRLRARSS